MAKAGKIRMIPDERMVSKIYLIRGQKVMLDNDLADLYDVETRRLKEAVRRNIVRFPGDFMFGLTQAEFESLRSQFATSKIQKMGLRRPPVCFAGTGLWHRSLRVYLPDTENLRSQFVT